MLEGGVGKLDPSRLEQETLSSPATSNPPPRSRQVGMLAKRVNKDIIGVVVWLVVVCILGGTLFVIWVDPNDW